jgi:hypothetical protein
MLASALDLLVLLGPPLFRIKRPLGLADKV